MKTRIAAVTLAAAALCAGSALAQTRPQAPAPRPGVPAPPPAAGTVPAGQGQGQTRGSEGGESNRDHIDQDAQSDVRGGARFPTNLGATPVNGVGGTGGGRMTTGQTPTNGVGGQGGGRLAVPGGHVINNSESEALVAPGGGGGPVAAEAIISTTRSNIKRPSSLAQGAGAADGGGSTSAPTPAPVTPR